jgi:DNA-binding GntR family transcriptional regulator
MVMDTVEKRASAAPDLQRPTTIGDALIAAMRAEILSGDLAPGARLHQGQLAKRYGTSRIPLRDALARLEQDGLVEIDARRGARVRALSVDDVEEIYDIRRLLEPLAVRLAVAALTDPAIRRLTYLSEAMDAASADAVAGQQARRTFYEELYALSGRTRLTAAIMRLRDEVTRYHLIAGESSRHAHADLRRAIKARDADAAATIVARHLEQARDDLLDRLAKSAQEVAIDA